MIDYEEMDYIPDDLVMVWNSNVSVQCDLVMEAIGRDPMPEIYY